jgi:sec-independent protein translocase protein TatA
VISLLADAVRFHGTASVFFNDLPTVFLFIWTEGVLMFEGLFQPMHLLIIFGISLLVFGPKKLPELGKGIGEGIRGFKSAMKADEEKPVSTTTIAKADGLTKE